MFMSMLEFKTTLKKNTASLKYNSASNIRKIIRKLCRWVGRVGMGWGWGLFSPSSSKNFFYRRLSAFNLAVFKGQFYGNSISMV